MIAFVFPVTLFVIYIIVAFFEKTGNYATDEKVCLLRLHKKFLVIGYVLSALMFCVSIFLYFYSGIEAAIVCIILCLISSVLVWGYYGYRVEYDKNEIRYRHFFEKYKTIRYKSIIDIEFDGDLIIRTSNNILRIPNYVTNLTALFEQLNISVKLNTTNRAKLVPRVRKFKDSVYRPKEQIFGLVLMNLVGIAMELMMIWAWVNEKNGDDLFGIAFVVTSVVCFVVFPTLSALSIISAKRAHSSEKWKKIAKICFKDGFLKD